jgi:hypothetical protein
MFGWRANKMVKAPMNYISLIAIPQSLITLSNKPKSDSVNWTI